MFSDYQQSMEKLYDHRFQRTDQWKPVYSWLESLDTDEVIKSKDVLDWLTANPEIRDHLYARHSRYHLMHYIKKCHVKILKRKEKMSCFLLGINQVKNTILQNLQADNDSINHIIMQQYGGLIVAKIPLGRVDHNDVKAPGSPNFTGCSLSSMPKDSELYRAKHSEASRKYEILVELEKQLLPLFGKQENQPI